MMCDINVLKFPSIAHKYIKRIHSSYNGIHNRVVLKKPTQLQHYNNYYTMHSAMYKWQEACESSPLSVEGDERRLAGGGSGSHCEGRLLQLRWSVGQLEADRK